MSLRDFRPWLWLPPKLAHDLSGGLLKLYTLFKDETPSAFEWQSLDWRGLHFRNPVGIAGGMDKDGDNLLDWQKVGAGFLEIGTVTPTPQFSNEGVIMGRDTQTESVWNRMGFPSEGARYVWAKLAQLQSELRVPVFVNIGKNRTTENSQAHADYGTLLRQFANVADVFVVNISSPNTEGLRDLFRPEYLHGFLAKIQAERERCTQVPLLLKLSPDLDNASLQLTVRTALDCGFAGFVLTNTTTARANGSKFPTAGGVSGRPLAARSKECLSLSREIIEKHGRTDCLLVSVGGIFSYGDVMERLRLGAHLTQLYSSLIFSGPRLFADFAEEARAGRSGVRTAGKTSH